jgi:hypothetical protein
MKILELADRWEFSEAKNLAARTLNHETVEPVQRIELFQRYRLDPAYLIPSYTALCTRTEPPTYVECERLGPATFYKIFIAREKIRADGIVDPEDVRIVISEIFDLDADALQRANDISRPGRRVSSVSQFPLYSAQLTRDQSGDLSGTRIQRRSLAAPQSR